MGRIRTLLARHRALTFVIITLTLTWAYEFIVVYPLVTEDLSVSRSLEATTAIAIAMFFPALGVVLTRLITGDGFKDCVIKPYPARKSLPWFLVAWFGPAGLIALGALLYFAVFPGDLDPEGTTFAALMTSQLEEGGLPPALPMSAPMMALLQIATGVLLGPLVNAIPALGEEWGWRGCLVPKMARKMSIVPTLLISGVIWGFGMRSSLPSDIITGLATPAGRSRGSLPCAPSAPCWASSFPT